MVKTLFQYTALFKANRMQADMILKLFSYQCSACFKGLMGLNSIVVQNAVAIINEEKFEKSTC